MHQKTLTVYDDEGGVRNFTAADVAELQQERNDLRAELATARRCLLQMQNAAIELAAQTAVPEAVAKDAERYRWLRSQKSLTLQTEKQPNKWTRHDGSTFSASHYLASGHTVHRVDVSLDATIDAAILSATDSEVKK